MWVFVDASGRTSPFSEAFAFVLSTSSAAEVAAGRQVITPVWKHAMPRKRQAFVKYALGWASTATFDMPKQARAFG